MYSKFVLPNWTVFSHILKYMRHRNVTGDHIMSTDVIHYLSCLIQLMITHWSLTNSPLYINILLHSYNSPGFKDALMSSVVVVSSLTIAPSVVLLSSYNHIRKIAVCETAADDKHFSVLFPFLEFSTHYYLFFWVVPLY